MFKKKNKIEKFPTHIAFIMDGNRRWAVRRGLNKMIGHKQGGRSLKNIISVLAEYEEIKYAITQTINKTEGKLPILLEYYNKNFEKSNANLLDYYNENNNLPEEFEKILKGKILK